MLASSAMRLALGSNAAACVALATALLSPTASAAKPHAAHPVPEGHVIAEPPPSPNAAHVEAKRIQSELSAEEVVEEGQGPLRNAPPPRSLVPVETTPVDPLDLIVYYGILGLLTLAAVGILYRYLAFRFSLDMVPEVPDDEAVGAANQVDLPSVEPAGVLGARDPRRPVARPAQMAAPPREVRAQAPPVLAAAAPKREPRPPAPASPPSEEQLLGQAAKILSGRSDWMTVGGIAEVLQADEWTTAKVLESLADSGRVQEAKAQNGQTVYRYAR